MPAVSKGVGSRPYNRDSVERALTLHVGMGGSKGWRPCERGYKIGVASGILHLRTLREAYVFVVGCAEARTRAQRVAS